MESFSADAMTVTFHGFNTHPGYAKGRMVNAIKAAARSSIGCPTTGCRRKRPTATRGSFTPM
jgi:tripeptide aminopeptidase